MAEHEPVEDTRVPCQARPAAARHGWRDDPLCASHAKTVVSFYGVDVPVCGIHAETFKRWAEEAEANAEAYWAWTPRKTLAHVE